jgi:hypothetical protein
LVWKPKSLYNVLIAEKSLSSTSLIRGKKQYGSFLISQVNFWSQNVAGVVSQKSLSFACHSGLDPESSVLSWIPAGVYPDEDRGRNDAFGINVKKR